MSVEWLTFDCYGTLIDWERGITDALLPLLPAGTDRRALAEWYIAMEAEFEPHFERGQFGDDVLEDGGWPGIGNRHHGSPAAKAAGGGTTAPRQTHHQHALAAQFIHPILPDRRCPFLRKYPSRIPETVSERDRRARRSC